MTDLLHSFTLFQWAWGLVILGIVLIATASGNDPNASLESGQGGGWILLGLLGVLLMICGAGCLVVRIVQVLK